MTKEQISCPLCGNIPDFPLYCKECKSFYCSDCHQQHLLDFLPPFEVPEHIQRAVMRDLLTYGNK